MSAKWKAELEKLKQQPIEELKKDAGKGRAYRRFA
jgi:hypothetical protein